MGEHKLKKGNGGEHDPAELLLRQMNHAQWLAQFSEVLKVSPRDGRDAIPMTPFRAGAISRLKMAADYIGLLQADLVKLSEALTASEHDLTLTRKANALLSEQIREHQKVEEAFALDKDLDHFQEDR